MRVGFSKDGDVLPRSSAFRALRVLLSCVAKKVSKESHPISPSVPLRETDSQSGGAFPEGTSLCRPETSRIVRAALRVFAPPACRASTGLKGKINSADLPHDPAPKPGRPQKTPAIRQACLRTTGVVCERAARSTAPPGFAVAVTASRFPIPPPCPARRRWTNHRPAGWPRCSGSRAPRCGYPACG